MSNPMSRRDLTQETARGQSSASNAELISGCLDGDTACWEQIVTAYERLVFAIALREGLDREDASDITQEVFAALVSSLDTIDDPDRLESWIMTVTRRKVWRRRADRVSGSPADPRFDPADDPSDALLDAVWMYDTVRALGEPCTSLIHALFFDPDEPTYEAVAQRLDRPIGSIGPTRSRCLSALRRAIESEDAR